MDSKGLALIVVHGVADQKPGDTARALVELMVAGDPPGAAQYEAVARTDFVVEVAPLQPSSPTTSRADATPRPQDRTLRKAWRQSRCSDLRAQDLLAQGPAAAAEDAGAAQQAPDRGITLTDYLLRKHVENGAGLEVYESSCIALERKAGGAKTPVTVYEMYWADLSRLSGALPRIVTELFTMVFRLAKLGRDTVDEAFVWRQRPRQGAMHRSAWNVTMRLQTALDWLVANVLALLFAQLILLTLVFVVLALAGTVPLVNRFWLHVPVLGGAALLSAVVSAYHWRGSPPRLDVAIAALLLAAACVVAAVWPTLRPWGVGLLLFGAVSLLYDVGLRIADARFPFTRRAGWVLWILLLLVVLASALGEVAALGEHLDWRSFGVGWHASLFGVEVVLLAIRTWWIGAGILLVLWFVAGSLAGLEKSFESRASLATGRLGLAVSLATFLTLTMAIWALLTTIIDVSARNVAYTPCIFEFDEAAAIRSEAQREKERERKSASAKPAEQARTTASDEPAHPNHCLWMSPDARKAADKAATARATASAAAPASALASSSRAAAPASAPASSAPASSARLYLRDRYEKSTTVFSFLVVTLLALFAYAAAMFMPSVLAEMKILVARTRDKAARAVARAATRSRSLGDSDSERARVYRLGRWLTGGFVGLDSVVYAIVAVGAVGALAVALAFLGVGWDVLRDGERWLSGLSQTLLKPLVLTAAGIVTMLSVLGGLLSRYLPALRAPLDIALDVDNHFREFPRAAIPRARIFSRYAALLRHVVAQGHDRIVIVAHSQGTVISAELLRYLASAGRGGSRIARAAGREPGADARPRPWLDGRQLPEISLLTLGCPLRQLYAARFPTLYRWVLARDGARTGPRAKDIGVSRWFNAFCSGDYVGRWLWADSSSDDDWLGRPMVDVVDPALLGRKRAYDAFSPMPPDEPLSTRSELEVCLGFGAHTHYFETEMETVAWLVDELVAPATLRQPEDRNIERP